MQKTRLNRWLRIIGAFLFINIFPVFIHTSFALECSEDIIVNGQSMTVSGGDYCIIYVLNNGNLTINGNTTAEEILVSWGNLTVNGNVSVAETLATDTAQGESSNITINGNLDVAQAITVYAYDKQSSTVTVNGNNNFAQGVDIQSGTLQILGTWLTPSVHVRDNGTLKIVPLSGWADSGKLNLLCDQLTVDAAGSIDGSNAGADPRGEGCGWNCSGGGGYGGAGGRGWWNASHPGSAFGDPISNAVDMGGKGGFYGGGALTIRVNESMVINGTIKVNGGENTSPDRTSLGAGSGGGLLIESPSIELNGMLTANGGNAQDSGGSGGGGRIKLFYGRGTTTDNASDNLSVNGGTTGNQPGQDGTVWIDAIPEPPQLLAPPDGAGYRQGQKPTFQFTVEDFSYQKDHRNDELLCIVELSLDNFKTVFKRYDQEESLSGWSEFSYLSGDMAEFTPEDQLPPGIFRWRSRVKDRSITGRPSEIRTFKILLGPPVLIKPRLD